MAITKDLGIATAYGYAVEKGYTGTEEEFAELMYNVAESAGTSEAWAVGSVGGVPVEEGAEQYQNNAKYYAEQAGGDAENAEQSKDSAKASADTSEAWAVGTVGGVPVEEGQTGYNNNAKYYAEQASDSKEAAANSEAAAKNYSDHIADPVSGIVTEWLNEHVDPESQVVIDDSLTIAGAAADAKATGDELTNVKSAISSLDSCLIKANLFNKETISSGILQPSTGNITANSSYFYSDYIAIELDKPYTYQTDASFGASNEKRIAAYDSNQAYIGFFEGMVSDHINTFTPSLSAVGVSVTSSDIKYVRICNINTKLDAEMFVRHSALPGVYLPYGVGALAENFKLNSRQLAEIPAPDSVPLFGKKILYNGDSICESRLNTESTSYNGGAYPKLIADATGCTYINYALGGAILASATPGGENVQRRISRDLQYMDDTADLICLEGGINDFWFNVPLGDYIPNSYLAEVDTTTLCGALESIFRQAQAKWVGKPIVFVIIHKVYNTVYTQNNAGYTFMDAYEKMIGICKKYAIPVYNAFEESGLNGYVTAQNNAFLTSNPTGMPDGCHPNEAGYKAYYVNGLIALFNKVLVSA